MLIRRVLIVGGGRQINAICSEYFRLRLGGSAEVESVEYCDDALEALSKKQFDLMLLFSIFTHWRTRPPRTVRFSGLELIKRMRALDIQVPVIVISASLLPEAKREALASGAFAFIRSPLNLAELDEALKKADVSG